MTASQLRAMLTAPPATAGSPVTFWIDDGESVREVQFFTWDKIVPTGKVDVDGEQKTRQTGPAEIRLILREVP